MKLKKLIIACVAGAAILATPIIPSKVSNAAPACPICGERVYQEKIIGVTISKMLSK